MADISRRYFQMYKLENYDNLVSISLKFIHKSRIDNK